MCRVKRRSLSAWARQSLTCSRARPRAPMCCGMPHRCSHVIAGTKRPPKRLLSFWRSRVADQSLAIIIVSYNVREELQVCLESFVGYTAPFPTTVTVVDNASTDETPRMVRERWPNVQLVEAGGNVGFARAN